MAKEKIVKLVTKDDFTKPALEYLVKEMKDMEEFGVTDMVIGWRDCDGTLRRGFAGDSSRALGLCSLTEQYIIDWLYAECEEK